MIETPSRGRGRRRRAALGLACALSAAAAGAQEARGDIAGRWEGPIEHAGQRSLFGLSLARDAEGKLQAGLALHALGAFDVPAGEAVLEGDTLRIGRWTARFDADAGTISGQVPSALLPVYAVPFTLHRVEAFRRPPAPVAAAERAPGWSLALDGPVWAGVAVADGRVFAATDAGTLRVVDEEDGAPAWSFRAEGAIRATPTVKDGAVFLHSDDGRAHRLDARSGEVVWSVRVGAAAERIPAGQAGSRYDHYASAVALAAGSAFVGTYDGALVALDPETGAERWRRDEDSSILGTPTSDGTRVFYGTFAGDVVARTASTGEELWRTATGGAVVGSPTVAGERVVIGTRAYDVLGLSRADGARAWSYYYWFSWVESSATLRDGVAYLGSSDGQRLQALRAGDGTPLWHFSTAGSTWATPAVTADRVFVGTVGVADYIVAHEARFHAVDRVTGTPVWQHALPRPEGESLWGFASSPAAGRRHVYVGTLDGRLLAFPLR